MTEWTSVAMSKSADSVFQPPRFFKDGEEVMDIASEANTQDNYTKVMTADLLTKLKLNRATHDAEWEEAHGHWRNLQLGKMRDYITAVQARIDNGENGGDIEFPDRRDYLLDEPISHADEYDKVIARLDMCVDETVHINHVDFDHFVLDDWSWKKQFAMTASLYNG